MVSVYLVSTFTIAKLADGWRVPWPGWQRARDALHAWRDRVHQRSIEKAAERAAQTRVEKAQRRAGQRAGEDTPARAAAETPPWEDTRATVHAPAGYAPEAAAEPECAEPQEPAEPEIPICPLEEPDLAALARLPPAAPEPASVPRVPDAVPAGARRCTFELPPTDLLNEAPGRSAYDEQELKDTAVRIKSKFEEFNVLGNVVQINPGPVVTTFEFKPEAGIKYSRITNLTEDLVPGPAGGIHPDRAHSRQADRGHRSAEHQARSDRAAPDAGIATNSRSSHSPPHHPLGKDINGRIRVAALEAMPHLLIAGSTGSGKSVMINSMIMSILYKATPDEVRMIMVDPKRVELGMYEGIPHLLTPVITDPKKATNALRNAVLEMERRLRLLAELGVRNIDQYNKKIRKLQEQPRNLFATKKSTAGRAPKPLPYILILIDELADLMMLEGKNVEESVTRLAQMARAVGMHLVLATQRPSVDVITGLIKANFPARISFRVATRVDSRTVLDVMGAEHLLGKGDMLFLPPGSSRLTRVHGAFVTETEINRVVDFWKEQATPEYDQSFLIAPPSDEDERRRRGARQRRAGPDVRRGRAPGAANGQGVHLHACSAICAWATAARRAFWT